MTVSTEQDGLIGRVVGAIADHRGVDPLALRTPLATVVDTDALDSLFNERPNGHPRGPGRIAFAYEDLTVTVDSSGRVEVTPGNAAETAHHSRSEA